MEAATIILAVLAAIGGFLGALYKFRSVYTVLGFFTTRRFPKTKTLHRYAVVIAARNEEPVLANLIRSIQAQDYPAQYITTFVVADNCTDQTARIARENGAVCYERFDTEHRTKGYALQFLFQQIRRDYGKEAFDAYIVFDADNLLKRDYVTRMNEAFDAGERIVTSYRNTKNIADNWIANSYAMHWMRTIRTEHRARSVFGLATRIQGTGLLIASDFLKDGWNYVTLTEDRELCAEAVVQGCPVSFCYAAEFYDEQPTSLRIAMRQRIRWSKGHLQVMRKVGGKLVRRMFTAGSAANSFMAYDMLTIVFPHSLYSTFVTFAEIVTSVAVWLLLSQPFGVVGLALLAWVKHIGKRALTAIITAIYVSIMERRHTNHIPWYKQALYCITFPVFDIIGRISMIIALFSRVEWKQIPHTAAISIEELDENLTAREAEREATPATK